MYNKVSVLSVTADLILRRLSLFDELEEEKLKIQEIKRSINKTRVSTTSKSYDKEHHSNSQILSTDEKVTSSHENPQGKEESTSLFRSSIVQDEDKFEEIVLPSTSKVSEKLSEVLASIRRAREKNAFEATQRLNLGKSKVAMRNKKGTKSVRNKKVVTTPKNSKDDSDSSDDFSTNFLNISITPEKCLAFLDGPEKTPTKESINNSKIKPKSKITPIASISPASEEDTSFTTSEKIMKNKKSYNKSNKLCKKVVKKQILCKETDPGQTSFTKPFLPSTNNVPNLSNNLKDECNTSNQKLPECDTSSKQLLKDCNKSNEENPKDLFTNKVSSDNSILGSKFEKIYATGASKTCIGEKLDVFLKRKFEFKPVNQNKKFKHMSAANNLEELAALESGSVPNNMETISSKSTETLNTSSKSNTIITCPAKESSSTILSNAKNIVNISSKTLDKLKMFSKNPVKSNSSPSVSKADLNSNNCPKGVSFNVTTYCDLKVDQAFETEGTNTEKTNSQANSVSGGSFSQPFSLIDGEENLDEIDFDL